jgi:predicted naringenin-chalcone synthase
MNQPVIHSIGTAVPANRISQEAHYTILESANGMTRMEKLTLRKIYSRSGIEYRHSVLSEFAHDDEPGNEIFHPSGAYEPTSVAKRMKIYETHSTQLCADAVRDCLKNTPTLDVTQITHLVTFSCTGMFAPGLDIQLIEEIGMQRNTERTCINFMGCYAAVNALKVAYHISRSEPNAIVLVAGVELCSLHYQKSNEQNQVVANALFSDGAAAVIVSSKTIESNSAIKYSLQHFYAEYEQSAADDMVWRIGNHGFDLRLTPEVPNVVKGNIKKLVEKLFNKAGIHQTDISYYGIHPGGTKILEACEEALHITKEQNDISYDTLRNYGNMSSVTILFVLKEYCERLSEKDKGKKLLGCAFGPGISMESMILEIC